MNPIHTQQCNFVLKAPPNQDQVVDLHTQRTTDTDGTPIMRSFWKPTPTELALLNAGQPVALDVMGARVFYPVYLHVQEK